MPTAGYIRRRNRKAAMAVENKQRKIRASTGELFAPPVLLPPDLVAAEVLTRLPAKSLMRFKCVSKFWLSTILDPTFCKAHRARSTGLLILSPVDLAERRRGLSFFVATPSCSVPSPSHDEPFSGPQHRDLVFDLLHHQFTLSTASSPPLHGLVCLYTATRAWLCSVSTGEIMDLPTPPPSSDNGATATYFYKCYLGYDNNLERFKVLRVVCSDTPGDSRWDILTLGGCSEDQASWRRLDDGTGPPRQITEKDEDDSVYINGERHWWHSSGRFLVRLSFKDEEFELVGLPPGFPELGGSLHSFRDRVALVTGEEDRKLQFWVLGCDCCYCHGEGDGRRYKDGWSKHALCIPFAFAHRGCYLLGNLITGLMLMTGPTTEQEYEQEEVNNNSAKLSLKATPPVYSYDLCFGIFDELVIGKMLPVGKDTSKLRIYRYREDIRPLDLFIKDGYDHYS